ncbi:guanylate kinase [Candidatus Puniceispirillum sp.]|uniref:guanylate kinase n=1 Tax=Candidatus Puniceispirillum sp. TaxID=2026719 RepID=UPI003F695B43
MAKIEKSKMQSNIIGRRGFMLVLSSPSGAGKTTIARRLIEDENGLYMSVSATTRPRRPGEVEGKDYYFVEDETFHLMANRGEFLEHANVFDHYYATPVAPVMHALSEGRDILFDIDWQGTQQIADKSRDDLVSVFILPPSTQDLEKRLLNRAQDSADVVAKRMSKAADEISHYREYDYIIVNEDVDKAISDIKAIMVAERLKRDRQIGLTDFVKELRSEI